MAGNKRLKQNDLKFRLLFEDNPLPMWVFDRETLSFLEVNQAAVAHYGYTREEFLGMTLADIRPPEDVARLKQAVAQAAGIAERGQWRHRLSDGCLIDVEVASHTVTYGGRRAVLSVLHDVTERKQLEAHLRQSAKMEAVGMLAGGIAHDFNNLLTIINGYSQILLGALPASDPNRSAVEQIMKAGERAAALTGQLLAFSRRQVLQPKSLDLNQLLSGMDSMLRRLIGEDVELSVTPGRDLGRVNADAGQIEQVVMNLVVNARDAMPRGGVLIIETSNVEIDRSRPLTQGSIRAGKYVALLVSDNGSGIDAETRVRLFEPFFTTKGQRGTGLGLTTVLGIVRQSGGGVEVSSQPGQGTSIRIYLPRADHPVEENAESSAAQAGRGNETILLVEDEEQVRNLVRETLVREGYKVLDAPDASEARRIGSSYKKPIHLLIADVVLPRESGRDLADSLASRRPPMKVLFMSGYTDRAALESDLLGGGCAFIQKPFTPTALARKVREILETNGETSRRAGK